MQRRREELLPARNGGGCLNKTEVSSKCTKPCGVSSPSQSNDISIDDIYSIIIASLLLVALVVIGVFVYIHKFKKRKTHIEASNHYDRRSASFYYK